MGPLIGCSAAIGAVAFVIGFVVSLFIRDITWAERLAMGVIPAIMASLAALLLACRDLLGSRATLRKVHNFLESRNDTSDEEFLALSPYQDAELLLDVRLAIARFFGVPSTKVERHIHLVSDLRVNKLEPGFQFAVVGSIVESRVTPRTYGFSMSGLRSIDDLANAIAKVLEDLNQQ